MMRGPGGWRRCTRDGMTQEQVAERMGVSVARVSQIGGGDVSRSRCEPVCDRAWRDAAPGDVKRMKLLAGPHVATFGYRLVSYGMQEVRGSNPRSSTPSAF